jgi:hypothetical protein
MARDFYINGESMVRVQGNPESGFEDLTELGLSNEAIHVSPRFYHHDVIPDDFGS